jgi:hypothetical protein
MHLQAKTVEQKKIPGFVFGATSADGELYCTISTKCSHHMTYDT